MWEIIEYTKPNGSSPVENFLDSLNSKQAAKVLRSIELLRNNGLSMGMPHIAYLGDGLYELRTKLGSNIFRVIIFHWCNRKLVLLNGFTKKTQKTPKEELERAQRYRSDFYNRQQKGD
jgi:phage-related protein